MIPRRCNAKRKLLARVNSAGPPHLSDFVSDLGFIPAQAVRDLFNREPAHEHIAQLDQLPLRPFPAGVHGRRFIVRLGPSRIEDRGTYNSASCSGFRGPLRNAPSSISVT
jgi:hypothetical protein